MDTQEYLTADEACEELGSSLVTFYSAKKRLGICGYGIGKKSKYRREDIERMKHYKRPLKATGRRKKIDVMKRICDHCLNEVKDGEELIGIPYGTGGDGGVSCYSAYFCQKCYEKWQRES